MKLRRLILALNIAVGLLGIVLITVVTASSQAPPGGSTAAAADPSVTALGELQEQVRELSSAVREMRTEVEGARTEAAGLRRELENTKGQLLAIRNAQEQASDQATARVTPNPSSAEQAASAGAQIGERVEKIGVEQQLLDAKVDDQYQTKVESGSKYRVRLSGLALFNAFTTRGATDNFDLPGIAQDRGPLQPNGGFGATLRQSILGLDVFGPDVAGAKTSADVRADFFGGFPNAPAGVTAGLVRLRTAGLRLDWQNTSLVAGQYTPFFSPLSPTSLASVAYPPLAYAGNLWIWTPQVYVEHRINLPDGSRLALQGGVMDPLAGELPQDSFYRAPQAGESAGQPAYAARIAWAPGAGGGPLSVGLGGYYARQNWGLGRMIDAWAATADWNFPLRYGFSLTGEFYRGRAIGGLGAAEGRSVATTGSLYDPRTIVRGLNSTGGWSQLKYMPVEKLEFNGAFGGDFSLPPELRYSARGTGYVGTSIGRNQSFFFNSIYHLRSNLMFSAEYRRLRTSETQPGRATANQVSLSAATLF